MWVNSGHIVPVCFKHCIYEICLYSFQCQSWVRWIQIQHAMVRSAISWAGRWELWLPETCVRGSSAISPTPAEFQTLPFALCSFGSVVGAFLRDDLSQLLTWQKSITVHNTTLHLATVAQNIFTSMEILFELVPYTPVLVNMCSPKHFSAGKELPASSRWRFCHSSSVRWCCGSCTTVVSACGKFCLCCWVTKLFHVLASG